MMLIPCPWCGERAEEEFAFGGESHIQRPEDPAGATDSQWADYLFFRSNPRGLHRERWQHRHGCRQWFNLARDTVTHEIRAVYRLDEPCPESAVGDSQ